jgi:hypothetical protein
MQPNEKKTSDQKWNGRSAQLCALKMLENEMLMKPFGESPHPGRSSWERWRLAGEFQFFSPNWPAGRRRSQEFHRQGRGEGFVHSP